MERGFPVAHEDKLASLGSIPPGVPGCSTIEELKGNSLIQSHSLSVSSH
jgi:hypothetical protein